MSNFDNPLIIEYDRRASEILNGDYWRLKKSFRFYLPATETATESESWAHCSAGMLTDLGSVPKVARAIIDRDGAAAQAYVLHDQLVEYLSITVNGKPQRITRNDADLILQDALIDLGISGRYAEIVFLAVSGYTQIRCNNCPSTYRLKRELEAAYNFEGLE